MILTGPEIRRQIDLGHIVIEPEPSVIGPNSVDMTLGDKLLVYAQRSSGLDVRHPNPTQELQISEEGFVLQPGTLYLGSTMEMTYTPRHVPYVDGRSSTGRLGISVHATAGRGDVGFRGRWTLEITVVHPVRVYAGMRIAQITFHEVTGELQEYAGRYQGATDVEASKMSEVDSCAVVMHHVVNDDGESGDENLDDLGLDKDLDYVQCSCSIAVVNCDPDPQCTTCKGTAWYPDYPEERCACALREEDRLPDPHCLKCDGTGQRIWGT